MIYLSDGGYPASLFFSETIRLFFLSDCSKEITMQCTHNHVISFIAADHFYGIAAVQSPDQYLEMCYPFKLCDCQILDMKIFQVKHYWISYILQYLKTVLQLYGGVTLCIVVKSALSVLIQHCLFCWRNGFMFSNKCFCSCFLVNCTFSNLYCMV